MFTMNLLGAPLEQPLLPPESWRLPLGEARLPRLFSARPSPPPTPAAGSVAVRFGSRRGKQRQQRQGGTEHPQRRCAGARHELYPTARGSVLTGLLPSTECEGQRSGHPKRKERRGTVDSDAWSKHCMRELSSPSRMTQTLAETPDPRRALSSTTPS